MCCMQASCHRITMTLRSSPRRTSRARTTDDRYARQEHRTLRRRHPSWLTRAAPPAARRASGTELTQKALGSGSPTDRKRSSRVWPARRRCRLSRPRTRPYDPPRRRREQRRRSSRGDRVAEVSGCRCPPGLREGLGPPPVRASGEEPPSRPGRLRAREPRRYVLGEGVYS
jgi:hypothetical protein